MKTRNDMDNLELSLEPESQKQGIRITVIGVGNGGLKVIDTLVNRELRGVDLIAADTDVQVLRACKAKNKIYLGIKKTKGIGAGGNPELGKEAVMESKEEIAEYLKDSDLVVVVAMLGKGTGSGSAPEILKIAKEHNILTLGLVVMPSEHEGLTRIAQTAHEEIARNSDAYMLLYNDNMNQLGDDALMFQSYESMNNVLADSIQALVDIVEKTGYINIQIGDIRTVLAGGGRCLISKGEAETGDDKRASVAIDSAVNDPLIQVSLEGAEKVIVCAMLPQDFRIGERELMMDSIRQLTNGSPSIIWGMTQLKDKSDKLSVYLIASGIKEKQEEVMPDSLDDEELTPVGPRVVETELPPMYNREYNPQVNHFSFQDTHRSGKKKRPVTEAGNETHVITNMLQNRSSRSELRMPQGRMQFPGDKKIQF